MKDHDRQNALSHYHINIKYPVKYHINIKYPVTLISNIALMHYPVIWIKAVNGQRVPGLVVHYGIPKSIEPLGRLGTPGSGELGTNRCALPINVPLESKDTLQPMKLDVHVFHECSMVDFQCFRITLDIHNHQGFSNDFHNDFQSFPTFSHHFPWFPMVALAQELHPGDRPLCPRRPVRQVCGAGLAQGGGRCGGGAGFTTPFFHHGFKHY